MRSLTLACLAGLAASIQVVDLSHETNGGNGTNATNSTEAYDEWVSPCAEFVPSCGPDPCMDIEHPCQDIQDDDEWMACDEENANWTGYDDCLDSEEGKAWDKCWEDAMPDLDACWDDQYGDEEDAGEYEDGPCDHLLEDYDAYMQCLEGGDDTNPPADDATTPPVDNPSTDGSGEVDRAARAEALIDQINLDDLNEADFSESVWRFLTSFSGTNPRTGEAKPFDKANITWITDEEWAALEVVAQYYDDAAQATDSLAQTTDDVTIVADDTLPPVDPPIDEAQDLADRTARAEALVDQINLNDFDSTKFSPSDWRFLTIFSGTNPRTGEAKAFDKSNIAWLNEDEWKVLEEVAEHYDTVIPETSAYAQTTEDLIDADNR